MNNITLIIVKGKGTKEFEESVGFGYVGSVPSLTQVKVSRFSSNPSGHTS